MADLRVGLGFDSHPPAEGRDLLLGGVRFEGEPGLAGHSDADVVCHALADALLGAAGLGDVGEHFPETDPATEGLGGIDLLSRALELLREAGYAPDSCDLVVVADRPHLAGARAEMREKLGAALRLGADRVSVKATRPEGLGLRGEGIGCLAVAVVRSA